MPASAPIEPPAAASPRSVASGIRHICCSAFHLSIPKVMNAAILMKRSQSAMRNTVFVLRDANYRSLRDAKPQAENLR